MLEKSSFGISGTTVSSLEKSKKLLGGPLTYFLHTAYQNAVSYDHKPVYYTVDDQEKKEVKLYLLCVGNGQFFGGGMRVVPEARLNSGQFEVVVFEDVSFFQALMKLNSQVRTGSHIDRNNNISSCLGKKIKAEPKNSEDKVYIEADGEACGLLPATFENLPASITIIAPKAFVDKHKVGQTS